VTGSWYSGESVYRYGTAVQAAVATQSKQAAAEPLAAEPHGRTQPAGHEHAEAAGHGEHDEPGEEAHETSIPAWVHRYLPPIQLHLLLAGLAVGFAAAAIGLSIRRWSQPAGPLPAGSIPAAAIRVTQAPVAPASAEPSTPPVAPAPATLVPATIQTPVFAARYWLTALILAALTAAVGLWMTGDWRLAALLGPLQHKPINVREDRLFWHVVFGVTIVVSALLLALATRVSARAKFFVGLFILICLAAVALQVWVGVLLLYDGMEGRLTGFVVK
jgi:hypothetical protein